MSEKRWLVTGNKGFIGSRLQQAMRCFGVDRDDPSETAWPPFDIAAHMAAQSGIVPCEQNPSDAVFDNIDYLRDLLRYAWLTKAGFVFASSAAADNPANVYGATKLIGEALVKEWHRGTGLPYWILRIGNVYGPGSQHKTSAIAQWCKAARDGHPIEVHGDGMQERGFVHVDDVCRAIKEVVNHPPGTYRVAGPAEKIGRVAAMLSVKTNTPIINTPPREPAKETIPMVPNWVPIITLNDGLDATLQWFMESGK